MIGIWPKVLKSLQHARTGGIRRESSILFGRGRSVPKPTSTPLRSPARWLRMHQDYRLYGLLCGIGCQHIVVDQTIDLVVRTRRPL